jgi:hypothetical protein
MTQVPEIIDEFRKCGLLKKEWGPTYSATNDHKALKTKGNAEKNVDFISR